MELSLPGVTKEFWSGRRRVFDLQIPPLEVVAGQLTYLIGHNGSGKSVYAEALSSSVVPVIDGASERSDAAPARIQLIRQRPEENICLDLSVGENLALWGARTTGLRNLLGRPHHRSGSMAESLLSRSGLRWEVDTRRLSTGERQILAFECARLARADVYILDEFTSGLDPAAKGQVLPEVRELNGVALIISHDVDEVCENADRVLAFCRGRLIVDLRRPAEGWERSTVRHYASGAEELLPRPGRAPGGS